MNNYKEIKTLGKGSFGRAVLVQEISTGKQYVMKIIQVSAMKPQEREEALLESKILEKLDHPNIVAYKESFTDQRYLYIVMEYANGGDLHDAIKAQKQKGALFDEDTVWNYFLQICLAVKHIHDRRILHRDMKTQNIFINVSSGRKQMKIGDFGVSKILSSTMECARTAIGTPYYLSPELCNNQGYNNKSDIWALGCILYEMCTMNHTFEAANMKMLIVKILEGRYSPISSKYSQQLKDVITAMLQKDPKKRPTINQLLRQPFIMQKIQQLLPDEKFDDEFAHTVFHGKGDILKGFDEEKQQNQPFLQPKIQEPVKSNSNNQKRDPTPTQQPPQPLKQPQPTAQQSVQKRLQEQEERIKAERKKAAEVQPVNAFRKEEPKPVQKEYCPSADTLAEKFNELDQYVAKVQSPQMQPPKQPVYQNYPSNVKVNNPPQSAYQPIQQQVAQRDQAAVGGMFDYNPPQIIAYPSNVQAQNNQPVLSEHQKEVNRQLAPMSDKDKVRYMKEKDLRERRDRAMALQIQHAEKVQQQQRERQQKIQEINKKYDDQIAQKKQQLETKEENERIAEERAAIANKAKLEAERELKAQQAKQDAQERLKAQQLKAEQDRIKMREFIEKKKQLQNQNQNHEPVIELYDPVQQQVKQPIVNQQQIFAQINAVQEEESSDFGDKPDEAVNRANQKEDQVEKMKDMLNGKNCKDSLCYRMENLKSYLEKELGFDNFFTVYQAVADANDQDQDDFDMNKVKGILGEEKMGYVNIIVQLLIVEQKFNEAQ
ncbi:Kinase [Hexamita inflata]|uniref:non-specific serine/threonine protein kinase n=1 Tax=Hexamita inflata TaxID=28002 RepID=A0AA86QNN6_9EUKA|nr:Kinase [Hexamita inflata]